ncbi:MAG: hypothetical protein A2622_07155 [Bdellovibrionales bacterium RIFCSPHIGHO2_01_FULL_40_29]|nr:MAG: hypothetical protein A2622_07155 [Bdellovibrionales bacterium RIFCSPHIGHO2_01_FULL_40_29]OFZ33252.1 MAG: hypothetical protein A3D17_12175 [Bdellovibrionales bacterium RIFCSPHIGHO2_02_FULL_40_15]
MKKKLLLGVGILLSFSLALGSTKEIMETPVEIVEGVMNSIGYDHPLWDISIDTEDNGVRIYSFRIEIKSGNDYDKIDNLKLSLVPLEAPRGTTSYGAEFEVIVSGRRNGATEYKNKQANAIFQKVLEQTEQVTLIEALTPKYILGTYAGFIAIKDQVGLQQLLTQIEMIVEKIDKDGLENVIGVLPH